MILIALYVLAFAAGIVYELKAERLENKSRRCSS
jgi:hypothetical protein